MVGLFVSHSFTIRLNSHTSIERNILFLSFLRGHSVFSSPPQRPMTSDFEGFLYQILSISLFSYFNHILNFIYLFYNDYETSYTTYINHARWHRCLRSCGKETCLTWWPHDHLTCRRRVSKEILCLKQLSTVFKSLW